MKNRKIRNTERKEISFSLALVEALQLTKFSYPFSIYPHNFFPFSIFNLLNPRSRLWIDSDISKSNFLYKTHFIEGQDDLCPL